MYSDNKEEIESVTLTISTEDNEDYFIADRRDYYIEKIHKLEQQVNELNQWIGVLVIAMLLMLIFK